MAAVFWKCLSDVPRLLEEESAHVEGSVRDDGERVIDSKSVFDAKPMLEALMHQRKLLRGIHGRLLDAGQRATKLRQVRIQNGTAEGVKHIHDVRKDASRRIYSVRGQIIVPSNYYSDNVRPTTPATTNRVVACSWQGFLQSHLHWPNSWSRSERLEIQ